jgi:hypothetical protein
VRWWAGPRWFGRGLAALEGKGVPQTTTLIIIRENFGLFEPVAATCCSRRDLPRRLSCRY